jgi:hypothetical protein
MINFQIEPKGVEASHLMQSRYYLREYEVPAFERLQDAIRQEVTATVERAHDLTQDPDYDPDFLLAVHDRMYGELYVDPNMARERGWCRLLDQFETIEARVKELTGKSVDDLDTEALDFWAECNTAA